MSTFGRPERFVIGHLRQPDGKVCAEHFLATLGSNTQTAVYCGRMLFERPEDVGEAAAPSGNQQERAFITVLPAAIFAIAIPWTRRRQCSLTLRNSARDGRRPHVTERTLPQKLPARTRSLVLNGTNTVWYMPSLYRGPSLDPRVGGRAGRG